MATELAKAYVQIIPSAQGMKKALEDILGDNMPSGNEPGKKIGSGIVGGIGSIIKGGAGAIGSAVSSVAKASAAVATATVTAAAGSVVALTKQAISAYADYEQLVGGIDKLYGEASEKVQNYAAQAYRTAGISANEYMDTATSFSAAMINSLEGDVDKAAELTDMAMRAMSDNANTFGSSFESIQNAYMGFSKQNYTMLDNLKLGYGGTKEEMERLIADANKLAVEQGLVDESILKTVVDEKAAAKASEALGKAQDAVNKKTTALEKAQLSYNYAIEKYGQNSTQAQKAALNLQSAQDNLADAQKNLADAQDALNTAQQGTVTAFDINNFSDIVQAIELIQEKQHISGLTAEEAAKMVASGAMTQEEAYAAMGTTAKEAASTISGSLQMVKSSWTNLVAGLGNKDANVGELVKQFTESVKTFGSNVLPIAKEALLGIGTLIKELVPEIVSAIPEIAQEVIPELAETISTLTPEIISAFEQIITSLVEQMPVLLPILLEGAIQLFMGIISALDKVTDVLIPMLPELISQITSALKSTIPQLISAGFDLLMGLVMGIADNAEEIVDAILDLIPQIIDTITDNLPQILEAGGKILYAIVTGIGDHLPEITQSVVKLVAVLLKEIVLHLPDILAAGADMLGSLAMGIVSTFEPLSDALSDLMLEFTDWASDLWDSALEWGGDLIDNFVEGIKNAASAVWDTLEDIGEGIADLIGFSEPEKGPLSNFHTYAPDMMKLFSEGIDDNSYLIEDSMNKAMNSLSMSSQQLPTTTPKGKAYASAMASEQRTITLRLTDAAGRVIAESTAPYIDIIQGESMMLAEMGIA